MVRCHKCGRTFGPTQCHSYSRKLYPRPMKHALKLSLSKQQVTGEMQQFSQYANAWWRLQNSMPLFYCLTWFWLNRKLWCLLAVTGRAASQGTNRSVPGFTVDGGRSWMSSNSPKHRETLFSAERTNFAASS